MTPTMLEQCRQAWPAPSVLSNVLWDWTYDRDKYIRNLFDVKNVLDAHGVKFLLAFGTLLGAIRDHGPCDGDQDTDLLVTSDDEPKLVKLFLEDEVLEDGFGVHGFRFARVSQWMITVARDHSYVDLYVFRRQPETEPNHVWRCMDHTMDGWRIANPWVIPLYGTTWNVPSRSEEYLASRYPNWMIPQDYHART